MGRENVIQAHQRGGERGREIVPSATTAHPKVVPTDPFAEAEPPWLIRRAFGGEDVLTLGYDEFIAPLIKAVQELAPLRDVVARQQEEIAALAARLAVVEGGD